MSISPFHRAWSIFFLFWLLTASGCSNQPQDISAKKGRLDLSGISFDDQRVIDLSGEWEVYWQQLRGPADFSSSLTIPPSDYFHIPGYWNGERADGRLLTGDGYATFRLKVRLPPGSGQLALRIEDQSTAYRLWINGVPMLANGKVGHDAASSQPFYRIATAALPTNLEVLDCILQVSNFHALDGGPHRTITLGSVAAIEHLHSQRFAIDLLLAGILGAVAVSHLLFFLLRRKDPAPLYFGGYCASWAIATAFGATGGRFVTLLWPECPWYLLARGDIICWFLSVPLAVMFFTALYPDQFPIRFQRIAQMVSGLFITYVVLCPSKAIGYSVIPYQVFSLAMAAYICVRLIVAVRHGQQGAGLMLVGFGIFVGTVVNDILYMNLVMQSVYLISAGMLAMVGCQAFVLALRFARSFDAVETLTARLEENNLALSRLDVLKDEFLAKTSHELRTPLNGIIGIAASLLEGATGHLAQATRSNLAMIVASGRRLAQLINDLLDFSRLRHDDLVLRCQPVDLCTVTEIVLNMMRQLAQAKSVELVNGLGEELPLVQADEDRLQQILFNLVDNAIKWTDQGAIRIAAAMQESMIEVSVSDDGIGIPEDRQESIFHSFVQVDGSDARLRGGTGLGLAISKELVELHGGSIRVESTPGIGSTFRFTLPISLEMPQAAVSVGQPRQLSSASTRPLQLTEPVDHSAVLPGLVTAATLLAVDDDPVNLQVVTNYLAVANLEVRTANSGRQAMALMENGLVPDLVLLDVMMPQMSGYSFCQWLRRRFSPSELPVIMLTAKSGTGSIVQGFADGANDYLIKPIVREELIARVANQLNLKQAYVALHENLHLKQQLEEQVRCERELRSLQRRLSAMLDCVQDALLAIDANEQITFCNQSGETLLGIPAETLLGKPVTAVLRDPFEQEAARQRRVTLRTCIEQAQGPHDLGRVTLVGAQGREMQARGHLVPLAYEDETICLLLLEKLQSDPGVRQQDTATTLAAIEAIKQNRSRLQSLQHSLDRLHIMNGTAPPGMAEELQAIDQALGTVTTGLLQMEPLGSRHEIAVEVMRCALDYWIECTGLSKADLAIQSRIWTTYTNPDGWVRTQTLDKYLQFDTLPQRPNWRKIFQTADFVLAANTVDSSLRARLEVLLLKMRVGQ